MPVTAPDSLFHVKHPQRAPAPPRLGRALPLPLQDCGLPAAPGWWFAHTKPIIVAYRDAPFFRLGLTTRSLAAGWAGGPLPPPDFPLPLLRHL